MIEVEAVSASSGSLAIGLPQEASTSAAGPPSPSGLMAHAKTHVHAAHLGLRVTRSMMKNARACLLVPTSMYAELAEQVCISAASQSFPTAT